MPELPSAPAAGPATGGAGAPPPQAPMGASGAMGPTANRGHEMVGIQKLGAITQQLTEVLALVGAQTEVGKEVLKVLNTLAKIAPPGSSSPAATQNHLQGAQIKNAQQQQMLQRIRQMQSQQGQPPQMPAMAPGGGGAA